MVFVPRITEVPTPDKLEVVWDTTRLSHSVVVPLAICNETDRRSSVVCLLTPFWHEDVEMYQFSFEIAYAPFEEGTEEAVVTTDRFLAAHYIPSPIRPLVMPIVRLACRRLLEAVRPNYIYRVADGHNLPPRALRKHDLLTSAIQSLGYESVESGTDRHGRPFWLMAL